MLVTARQPPVLGEIEIDQFEDREGFAPDSLYLRGWAENMTEDPGVVHVRIEWDLPPGCDRSGCHVHVPLGPFRPGEKQVLEWRLYCRPVCLGLRNYDVSFGITPEIES